jgi:hypothetical protein
MTEFGAHQTGPVEEPQRAGSLLAAAGAAMLAVSVFLPWYAFRLTANGVAMAQQGLNSVAQQFGNSTFRGLVGTLGNSFGALAGHQVGTVSAHQALKVINILLLILAAIAFAVALMRLAHPTQSGEGRGLLASVGVAAALLIVFRMVDRPSAPGDFFAVSLSWGIWLALLSAAAIVAGDLWPRRAPTKKGLPPIGSWWAGY